MDVICNCTHVPHVAPPADDPVHECDPACLWMERGHRADRRSDTQRVIGVINSHQQLSEDSKAGSIDDKLTFVREVKTPLVLILCISQKRRNIPHLPIH